MTRLGSAFVAGFHQRGEVFLPHAANVELVDSGGKFFEIFITLGDRQFFQPGDENRGCNSHGRAKECVQHIVQQIIDTAGNLLRRAGVEVVEANHQAVKRTDNPHTGQNTGQVFEEFRIEWNID